MYTRHWAGLDTLNGLSPCLFLTQKGEPRPNLPALWPLSTAPSPVGRDHPVSCLPNPLTSPPPPSRATGQAAAGKRGERERVREASPTPVRVLVIYANVLIRDAERFPELMAAAAVSVCKCRAEGDCGLGSGSRQDRCLPAEQC